MGVDSTGLAYLAGASYSEDFPVSSGAFQDTFAGGVDAYVSSITPVPTVTVTASEPDAAEAGPTAGEFTLTRTGDLSESLTVNYVIGGTALGQRYTGLTRGAGTATFAADEATVTLTLTPVDDTVLQGPETVVLTLVAGAHYGVGTPLDATGTIADDETRVTIAATQPDASEDGPVPGEFTVYRQGDFTDELTVNYTVGGTASSERYESLAGSVTIPAGDGSVSFDLTPIPDETAEGIETVTLTLGSGSYLIGEQDHATVTIADMDAEGTVVTLDVTDPNAQEAGNVPGVFTLYRTGDLSNQLTVFYTVSGTASANRYHEFFSGGVTFAAGAATALLTVTPMDDHLYQGSQTVILTLDEWPSYTLGNATSATVTIADNDTQVSLSASTPNASLATSDPGAFAVTRVGDLSQALTVAYTVSGTAASGAYEETLSGTVTIPADENSATLTITPTSGTPNGTLTVTLTLNSGDDYSLGTSQSDTVALVDDVTTSTVVTLAATAANLAEEGSVPGELTFYRTGTLSSALTVNYTLGGTASSADYEETLSGSIVIPADEDRVTLTITPEDDSSPEGVETLVVTLASGTGYTTGSADEATVTLADNDTEIAVAATTDNTTEGDRAHPGVFTFTRSGDLSRAVTVAYEVSGTATADDYDEGLSGTLTFAAGQSSITQNLTAIDDDAFEGAETVIVTLTEGSGYTLGTDEATITIRDTNIQVSVTATAAAAAEGDPATAGTFTVTRAGDLTDALTVHYSLAGSTADAADYEETLSGTVTIAAGEASATVTVTPVTDSTVEGTETVLLTLTADAAYTLAANHSALLTIADADASGTVVTVAATVPNADEVGPQAGVVTFYRTGDTSAALTVDYTLSGTADAADYAETLAGSVTFSAGHTSVTQTVTPVSDHLFALTATLVLTLATGTGYTIGSADEATVTLADSDQVVVTVAATTDATESDPGEGGIFTITRAGDVSSAVTVTYAVSGTASSGLDYTPLTGNVTIAAGESSASVQLTPLNDSLAEAVETVVLTLTAASGYTVGATDSATLSLTDDDTPGEGDEPADAVDDQASTDEDTAVNIDVLANDLNPGANVLTLSVVSSPLHGSAVVDDNGTALDPSDDFIVYTPSTDFNGTDSFVYRVTDDNGGADEATVIVTVAPVNDAPVADSDAYSVPAESTLEVIIENGLLANDSDIDGDRLSAVLVTDVSHGTLELGADGDFVYQPEFGFHGTDYFTYQASDGTLESDEVTVTLTVTAVDHAPQGFADFYNVDADSTLTVSAYDGVLDNDVDVDSDTLTVTLLTDPGNGTVELDANGSFVYTPAEHFDGIDSFIYEVSDGTLTSEPIEVTIEVARVDQWPVAETVQATTTLETEVEITVLDGASDPDEDDLTVLWVSEPSHGTAVLNEDNTVTYTPEEGFVGTDHFDYTVDDGRGGRATADVFVGVDDTEPTASDDEYTVAYSYLTVTAEAGVLANDTDEEGDALYAVLVVDVSHGTLSLAGDGSFVYHPDAEFEGEDSFTYVATDGVLDSEEVTVTLTVDHTNHAPTGDEDSYTGTENVTLEVSALDGVLANDTDEDDDVLTVAIVDQGEHGTVFLASDGSFRYQPDADFFGSDTFTYEVSDGVLTSDPVEVSITIEEQDTPLTAVDEEATTDENTPVSVDVLADDLGVTPDTRVSFVTETTNTGGTVSLDGSGGVLYAPALNYAGNAILSYVILNGLGQTSTATLTITVAPVNQAPTAVDDLAQTVEDEAISIDALANDWDPEGDTLSLTSVGTPSHGTAAIDDGKILYTPAEDYTGSDTISYTVGDGHGGTASGAAQVWVSPTDIPTVSVVATDATASRAGAAQTPDAGTFTFTRTGSLSEPLVVCYQVGGSAVPPVKGGEGDYAPQLTDRSDLYGSVRFGVGAASVTLTIYPTGHNWLAADRTVTLMLTPFNPEDATDPLYQLSSNASATITIIGPNRLPLAHNDQATTNGLTSLDISVLANDFDPLSQPLTVAAVTTPSQGTATIESHGQTVRYTPAGGASYGTVTFGYTLQAGTRQANAVVTVAIRPAAPVIQGLTYGWETPATIAANQEATRYTRHPLTGTAPANSTVTITEEGRGVIGQTTASVAGVWTFTEARDHAEGVVQYTATATVSGVTSQSSAFFRVTTDLTPPTVTLQITSLPFDLTPEVRVTAYDNIGELPDGTEVIIYVLRSPGGWDEYGFGTLRSSQAIIELNRPPVVVAAISLSDNGSRIRAVVRDRVGRVGRAEVPLRLEARSGAWRVYAAQQVFDPLGSLQLSHPLDLDTAPGVSTKALGFSLVYNSSLVVPAPVLQMSLQSPNNQALPGSLYVTLRWYPDGKGSESGSGGRSLSWTLSLAGYAPGDLITMRIPVSADWVTQALRYAWKITVKTSATSSEELASEKGLAFVASTRTAGLNWSMGAGWGFSAVDRLVRLPAEDSLPAGVARVSANGSVAFYEQPTTELGTYGRQPGDPGALRKVNDTTYLYTLPTGEQWQYTSSPPSGSITWWRSADRQEQIMFSFDNTGRLTAVDAGGPTNA